MVPMTNTKPLFSTQKPALDPVIGPVIGTIRLLPLPGSPAWGGWLEPVFNRAEQEALAYASSGAEALLVENTSDLAVLGARLPVAAAIAMAELLRRLKKLTALPVGICVRPNDPETALAIALNTKADFMVAPLLAGVGVTASGLLESRLPQLIQAQSDLRIETLPPVLTELSLDHLAPQTAPSAFYGERSALAHLLQVAKTLTEQGAADGFILRQEHVTPDELAILKTSLTEPLYLAGDVGPETVARYAPHADGFLLGEGVLKTPTDLDSQPTVDPLKVQHVMVQLRPARARSEEDSPQAVPLA